MADKTRLTMIILIVLVVVLGAFVLYSFVIQPALQGYVVEKQAEGAQIAVNTILAQIQQYGYVQIPLGQNQTLILVPYNPSQQPAQ
jgi:capsular polysaccharide biosynthesis protein